VLCHAEDDHLLLSDSRLEPVVSAAFHLLFTGPATHPDQVAQWLRSTNIRSENRATTTAITALAKAHGLDANAYMESLAEAMR
jgi:hypothetical protein